MTLKNGFGLFYQLMDEKIKTWTLCFTTKEKPNMDKALFSWPVVLQYDVKTKDQLICRNIGVREIFCQGGP